MIINRLLLIGLLLIALVVVAGCATARVIVDPCAEAFEDCKYGCGQGWGAGLCQDACTIQYNRCERSR
jgi:hypothetical protein